MRVVAGKAKGTRLKSPTTGTRPMMDRMKESLFSALGPIEGERVLDLYAGSGSLGLEAVSRGATFAMFIENAREALTKLEQNIEATKFAKVTEVLWADVKATLKRVPDDRYDLIFLDPPYNFSRDSVQEDLELLVMNGFLSDEGKVVLHRPAKESEFEPLGLTCNWNREFGQSRLYIFVHDEEEDED